MESSIPDKCGALPWDCGLSENMYFNYEFSYVAWKSLESAKRPGASAEFMRRRWIVRYISPASAHRRRRIYGTRFCYRTPRSAAIPTRSPIDNPSIDELLEYAGLKRLPTVGKRETVVNFMHIYVDVNSLAFRIRRLGKEKYRREKERNQHL